MARQFFTGVKIKAGDENTLYLDTGTTGQQTTIFYQVNGSYKYQQRVGTNYEIYNYAASEWSLHLGSTGRLGLGTTNPGARLDVEGGALGSTSGDTKTAAIIRAGRQNLVFKDTRTANDSDWRNATFKIIAQIDSTNHQSIDFVNDNNYYEHIDIRTGNQVFHSRFTYNGRLGLGTTDPTKKLDVRGDATFTGDITTSGNIILSGAANEIIKSNGSIRLNIDSDNNQTDRVFIVSKHNNSELFRVDESGQVTSGRLLATASGTGIHQLVNGSTNSIVLQLITTGDNPDLVLNLQSDHIYNTGSALHIQNNDQPLYLKGSQTTVGTTSAESGYELTVSDGPGSSIYAAGDAVFAGNITATHGRFTSSGDASASNI